MENNKSRVCWRDLSSGGCVCVVCVCVVSVGVVSDGVWCGVWCGECGSSAGAKKKRAVHTHDALICCVEVWERRGVRSFVLPLLGGGEVQLPETLQSPAPAVQPARAARNILRGQLQCPRAQRRQEGRRARRDTGGRRHRGTGEATAAAAPTVGVSEAQRLEEQAAATVAVKLVKHGRGGRGGRVPDHRGGWRAQHSRSRSGRSSGTARRLARLATRTRGTGRVVRPHGTKLRKARGAGTVARVAEALLRGRHGARRRHRGLARQLARRHHKARVGDVRCQHLLHAAGQRARRRQERRGVARRRARWRARRGGAGAAHHWAWARERDRWTGTGTGGGYLVCRGLGVGTRKTSHGKEKWKGGRKKKGKRNDAIRHTERQARRAEKHKCVPLVANKEKGKRGKSSEEEKNRCTMKDCI